MGSTHNNFHGSPAPGSARQNPPARQGGRLRNFVQFLAAVLFFFLARSLARHAAQGLVSEVWQPLTEQLMLLLLLVIGYSAMGLTYQRQTHPIAEQGLPRRQGWQGEFGLGLALGWAVAIVCVLPMVLAGGIAVALSGRGATWGWLLADTAFFLVLTLVEEFVFRGFGFQCLLQAVGPVAATLFYALFYAVVQLFLPGAGGVSFAAAFILALLLTTAYLRTRALWVGWGINFAWMGSRALLFGLIVKGVGSHSSIVESTPMAPSALTGGYFGLDGTWVACLLLCAAIPVLIHLTRDLDFEHNAPVIIPGGYPVDLDAQARAQHEAVMGPPSPPPLVQIFPATAPEPSTVQSGTPESPLPPQA